MATSKTVSELLGAVGNTEPEDFAELANEALKTLIADSYKRSTGSHGFPNAIKEASTKGNYEILYVVGDALFGNDKIDHALPIIEECFDNGIADAGVELGAMILSSGVKPLKELPGIIERMLKLDNTQLMNAQSMYAQALEAYTDDANRLEGKFTEAATGSAFHDLGKVIREIGKTIQPYIDNAAIKSKAAHDSIADGQAT